MPAARSPLRPLLRPSLIALAAGATLSVQAQTPAATEDDKKKPQQLETVVISATKRDTPAHKVPLNVTAITEQQLRDAGITDLKSLIANSPAIEAPPNSARFVDSVTVRGLNISSASANNIEWFSRSTLSYYLDEAPLPNIGLRIKDVARVETLLGPQGTLYGGGALGGVVRYVTNKPTFDRLQGRISTEFFQTKHGGLSNDSDAMLNAPLGESLALRVAVSRLDDKGYTDRYAATPSYLASSPWTPKPNAAQTLYKDDDWHQVDSGRVALRWRLSPDLELQLSHAEQSGTAHGSSGAQLLPASGSPARYEAPPAFDKQTLLSPYPEFTDRDIRISTLELDWKLPGLGRLHSSTSSYRDSRVGQADYLATGSYFYGDLGYSRFRLGSPSWAGNTAYITYDNRDKGLLHETRLVSEPGVLSWVAGLFYAEQERSLQFSEWMPGLEALKTPGRGRSDEGYFENQASDYREAALFGEINWKATDKLTLSAGARVFSYRDRSTTQVEDYAFDLVSGVVKAEEKDSGKSYYKLNAAYQFSEDLLGYATFSQGFRRGGANGFRGTGNQAIAEGIRGYRADSTDNLEIGVKGYLADRQVYLQANIYRIDWKQPQTYFSQDINGFPVWGTTNGPDALSHGVELQGRWRPLAGVELGLSSTYTAAEWNGTREVCLYADNSECRTYTKGGKLGGSAPWKHALSARWNGEIGNASVWVAANARYIGVKASDRGDDPADRPFEYKAYTTYRLSAGMGVGDWDFSAWINNLSNNRELVSFQGTSAVGSRTGLRAIYLTPRTIGLSASYRF